jgi:hypothetical protein
MGTIILILVGSLILVAALPWIIQAVFGRRWGVWFGFLEILGITCLVPYWIYLWRSECAQPQYEIIGNEMYDNDSTCRALFLGAPVSFVWVTVAACLLVPSVFVLLLESRNRSRESV